MNIEAAISHSSRQDDVSHLHVPAACMPIGSSKLPILLFLCFAVLLVDGEKAWAACKTIPISGSNRWSFNDVYWTYSGGLPKTAVVQGAASWNSPTQSITAISEGTMFDDIHIVDSNMTGTDLARMIIYPYGYSGGASPCYQKRSYSCPTFCFGSGKIWKADMLLNNNNIGGAAWGWAGTWGCVKL
jgi:hypothetical protein